MKFIYRIYHKFWASFHLSEFAESFEPDHHWERYQHHMAKLEDMQ